MSDIKASDIKAREPKAVIEVVATDLQGPGVVACPNPKMTLWSTHPKVFIDVATTGVGKCPYCGTEYRLKAGEKVHGGH
ncbi:MAG: zinc-finger domain-containing protein [Cytophagales bacterium]|nr:zinc-finger domain-containing protein [Rhizobacter sp.]